MKDSGEEFNSFAYAVSTVERLHNLKHIQPNLAWKPLHVIEETLQNTTQFARTITHFPMQDHHKSRFPWDNRQRLQEDVAMDTYFCDVGIDGYECAQLFVGLVSTMINVYPMTSKASINIVQAYKDFMRYEGVPVCLHRDYSPEQKIQALVDLNRDYMVRDSFAEPYHLNQNPAEALGVKVIKTAARMIMNRTGAKTSVWLFAHKYVADIHNHCASPMLNWKTPISVRHGYTPDISVFLQYQFWEKVYFHTDEAHPRPKERPGYWMGVNNHVGDALTYNIYTEDTGCHIIRSVIRTADPKKGGIPNLRVPFQVENDLNVDNKVTRKPATSIDQRIRPTRPTTTKVDKTTNSSGPQNKEKSSYGPKTRSQILKENQENHFPVRRSQRTQPSRTGHVTSSFIAHMRTQVPNMVTNESITFNTGHRLLHATGVATTTTSADINKNVIEGTVNPDVHTLNSSLQELKMKVQHMDILNDKDDKDIFFNAESILDHRIAFTPRKKWIPNPNNTSQKLPVIHRTRHVRIKVKWENGEVGWISADSLAEQNPWLFVSYVRKRKLHNHPDFKWVKPYEEVTEELSNVLHETAEQSKGISKFKFGVQVPANAQHAINLDKILGGNL